ncbi:MAG: hypothetical protein QM634_15000, partial [Gordonia sp. (in: high G+C Gram-positive bacteria)]
MAKDDPDSRPIPASELLARKRAAANAAEDTGEIPRVAFPRSTNPVPQRSAPPASGPRTASGMPSFQPGQTAESDAAVTASNKVTGVIPAVDNTITGPATGSFYRSDDEIDFESYRNFDDVVATDEPVERKKGGLFSRRKRKEKAPAAEPVQPAADKSDDAAVTGPVTRIVTEPAAPAAPPTAATPPTA